MLDFDAITDAAVALLADLGGRPMDLAELAAAVGEQLGLEVVEHDPADPWDEDELSADVLDELLLETDDVLYLADDRVAHRAGLLDGLVLTRRVTREELDAGELELSTDLLPLLTINDRDGIAVVGGGTARVHTPRARADEDGLDVEAFENDPEARARAWRLALPAGTLDGIAPDALVGVRLLDGALEVLGEVEPDPEATARTVEVLRATIEDRWEPDEPVEGGQLIAHARVNDATVLRSACAPLSELYDQAGLDTYGDWVAPDGFDWDAWLDDRRIGAVAWELAGRHGLEPEDAQLLTGVLGLSVQYLGGDERARDPQGLALVGRAITDPVVAIALFIELAMPPLGEIDPRYGRDEVAELLEAVRDAAEQLDGHAATAGASYVLALLAEADADPQTAQRLLRETVDADPGFAPAWWDLSGYAADAGDPAKALAHLRSLEELGAEPPDDDAYTAMVLDYARSGPATARRNEPCPCGSGRKHKACCGPHNGWPLADRVQWVCAHLISHSRRPHCADLTDAVLLHAIGDRLEGPSADVDGLLALFLAIFDAGLVDEYLSERGVLLPPDEREMLDAWTDVRVGYHEVVDVDPGDGLELLDLTSGERVAVRERSASQQLRVGDQLLAHLLPVPGDRHQLTGGVRRVADHERASIVEVVGRLVGGETDPFELAEWLAAAAGPPRLTNTEGQELVHHALVWQVEDPEVAARALTEAYGEPDEDEVGGDEAGLVGDRWVAYVADDPEGYVRAHLTLSGSRLTVEVNSVERAEAVRAWISDHLAGAQLVDETIEPFDVDAAYRAARGARGAGRQAPGPDLADLDDDEREELRAALDDMMIGFEQRWVDEPVPALGGLTPRQALDDPTRRDDVIRLVDEMDQRSRAAATGAGLTSLGGGMNADRVRCLLGL